MIHLFEALSFLLAWGYTAVFFLILKSFLPLREPLILKVIAFLVCGFLADSIIYSNDPGSLFGTMLLFLLFVLLFYHGTFMEKLSVLLVFYPALIAMNYLMLDIGGRLFKLVTGASYEDTLQSPKLALISTAIHTASLLLRLLFWIGAWLVLRRFLEKIPSHLNTKTWLIIDMLILSSWQSSPSSILCPNRLQSFTPSAGPPSFPASAACIWRRISTIPCRLPTGCSRWRFSGITTRSALPKKNVSAPSTTT